MPTRASRTVAFGGRGDRIARSGRAAMKRLRLVSITHPALGDVVGTKRLDLLPTTEVTILTPNEGGSAAGVAGTVRRISMPTNGRNRRARFPSLPAALNLLDPDVVHLHADPDTGLAAQVSRLCSAPHRRRLVLETEMNSAEYPHGWAASLRARQTLARTSAVLTRTAGALACLRRLGFLGPGLIAGRGLEKQRLPETDSARRLLDLADGKQKVIGWAGPLDARSHITDVLEAVALCKSDVMLVIPAAAPGYQDVLDRADALEILHRVRFVAAEHPAAAFAPLPDLSSFPTMLAACDALLLAPPDGALSRAFGLRTIELAHTHAIPVIHSGRADMIDMVGAGGWQVPFGDPALLARLFDALHTRPHLLAAAREAAAANAQARHSPEAAAAELARAIGAASVAGQDAGARLEGRPARAWLGLALHRQPGST